MPYDHYYGVSEQAKACKHRLDDAKALFEASRWRGSMYLAGYAVECLLKTKLMRMFKCRHLQDLDDELQDRNIIPSGVTVFTHQLELLLGWTGARHRLQRDRLRWQLFNEANRWLTAWRYSPNLGSRSEAEYFFEAVEKTLNWIENNV
jgi:HEPN domain-containing protein